MSDSISFAQFDKACTMLWYCWTCKSFSQKSCIACNLFLCHARCASLSEWKTPRCTFLPVQSLPCPLQRSPLYTVVPSIPKWFATFSPTRRPFTLLGTNIHVLVPYSDIPPFKSLSRLQKFPFSSLSRYPG